MTNRNERRHELEQNELADWMANSINTVKPYQNGILGGVLLLVVALIGYAWWANSANAVTATGWDALYTSLYAGEEAPDKLEEVAAENKDTELGAWANTLAGDMYLTQGCQLLFSDKGAAAEELSNAVSSYTRVAKSNNSVLRERAAYGLARALESQAGLPGAEKSNTLEPAIAKYQEVAKWPGGTYSEAAQRRLDDLEKPASGAWYGQFSKFKPREAFEALNATKATDPFDLDSLPKGPTSVLGDSSSFSSFIEGADETPVTTPEPTTTDMVFPEAAPEVTTPEVTTPEVTTPEVTTPETTEVPAAETVTPEATSTPIFAEPPTTEFPTTEAPTEDSSEPTAETPAAETPTENAAAKSAAAAE